jgi:hypothetical protein
MSDRRLRSPTLYPAELRALPVETASKHLKNTQARHEDATTLGDSETASSEVLDPHPLNESAVAEGPDETDLEVARLLRTIRPKRAAPKPPPGLHADLLRIYLENMPGSRATGFRRALVDLFDGVADSEEGCCEATGGEGDPAECSCLVSALQRWRSVPDAYVINREEEEIIAVEVQNTCPVSPRKLDLYIELFWALDEYCWTLGLHLVDRSGSVFRVDMSHVAIEACVKSSREILSKQLPGFVVAP